MHGRCGHFMDDDQGLPRTMFVGFRGNIIVVGNHGTDRCGNTVVTSSARRAAFPSIVGTYPPECLVTPCQQINVWPSCNAVHHCFEDGILKVEALC